MKRGPPYARSVVLMHLHPREREASEPVQGCALMNSNSWRVGWMTLFSSTSGVTSEPEAALGRA
ncbi:hypothetical protein HNP29_004540 [Pseudomonas alcaligenes]|nr:hypothetical protein [Pseudomonas alcaligenes]